MEVKSHTYIHCSAEIRSLSPNYDQRLRVPPTEYVVGVMENVMAAVETTTRIKPSDNFYRAMNSVSWGPVTVTANRGFLAKLPNSRIDTHSEHLEFTYATGCTTCWEIHLCSWGEHIYIIH